MVGLVILKEYVLIVTTCVYLISNGSCKEYEANMDIAARVAALEIKAESQTRIIEEQNQKLQGLQNTIENHDASMMLCQNRINELDDKMKLWAHETIQSWAGSKRPMVIPHQSENKDVVNHLYVHDTRDNVREENDKRTKSRLLQTTGKTKVKPVVKLDKLMVVKNEQIQTFLNTVNPSHNGNLLTRRFVTSGAETVAFHATIDGYHNYYHYRVGQAVTFPDVKLNIGGGYHSSAGLFIAPAEGVYIFSASVFHNPPDGDIHLNLVKNNATLASFYANSRGGQSDQGSVTVTMMLAVGDEVFVKVYDPDDATIWGNRLTSFTGCLITPL